MNCEEFIAKHGREALDRIFIPRKKLQEEYPIYFASNMLFILDGDFIGQFLRTHSFANMGYAKAREQHLSGHSEVEWEYLVRTTPLALKCGRKMEYSRLILLDQSDIIAEAHFLRRDHTRFVEAFRKASRDIEEGISPQCPTCEEWMHPDLHRDTLRWKCSGAKCFTILP